jgi:hypothetical protein
VAWRNPSRSCQRTMGHLDAAVNNFHSWIMTNTDDPEGVAERSHGWSEAEPVVPVGPHQIPPRRGGGNRPILEPGVNSLHRPPPLPGRLCVHRPYSTGSASLHPWLIASAPSGPSGLPAYDGPFGPSVERSRNAVTFRYVPSVSTDGLNLPTILQACTRTFVQAPDEDDTRSLAQELHNATRSC